MRRTITACAFMYPLASSLLVFLFSEPAFRRYNACEPVGMPHATLGVAGVEWGGPFLFRTYRRGRTSFLFGYPMTIVLDFNHTIIWTVCQLASG